MEFTVYVCELRSFSVSGIRFSMFYLHFHYCSFGRNVMTFVALFTGVDHGRAGDKSLSIWSRRDANANCPPLRFCHVSKFQAPDCSKH